MPTTPSPLSLPPPLAQSPLRDVNAPDLFIPLCSVGALIVIHAAEGAAHDDFTPVQVNSDATWYFLVWLLQWGLITTVLKLGRSEGPTPHGNGNGNGYGPPGATGNTHGTAATTTRLSQYEVVAYAGYLFTYALIPSVAAFTGSQWLWYGALFMAWAAAFRFYLCLLEAIKISMGQRNAAQQNYAIFVGLMVELFVLAFIAIKPIRIPSLAGDSD